MTVHGIQGEQAAGQSEGGDHLLGGRDLVAFLGLRQVSKNDLAVGGKGAQQMRRLAVMESIEAAAQGFAIDGHRGHGASASASASALGRSVGQSRGMGTERPLDRRGVEAVRAQISADTAIVDQSAMRQQSTRRVTVAERPG